jgi:hypothetical protein
VVKLPAILIQPLNAPFLVLRSPNYPCNKATVTTQANREVTTLAASSLASQPAGKGEIFSGMLIRAEAPCIIEWSISLPSALRLAWTDPGEMSV